MSPPGAIVSLLRLRADQLDALVLAQHAHVVGDDSQRRVELVSHLSGAGDALADALEDARAADAPAPSRSAPATRPWRQPRSSPVGSVVRAISPSQRKPEARREGLRRSAGSACGIFPYLPERWTKCLASRAELRQSRLRVRVPRAPLRSPLRTGVSRDPDPPPRPVAGTRTQPRSARRRPCPCGANAMNVTAGSRAARRAGRRWAARCASMRVLPAPLARRRSAHGRGR